MAIHGEPDEYTGPVGEGPEWLTVDQACEYLKVTRPTIYRRMKDGSLKFHELKSGGGRRFRRQDLDALLKPGKR